MNKSVKLKLKLCDSKTLLSGDATQMLVLSQDAHSISLGLFKEEFEGKMTTGSCRMDTKTSWFCSSSFFMKISVAVLLLSRHSFRIWPAS